MAKRRPSRVIDPAAREFAALIAREVRARCGADATFEQRREMAATVAKELLAQMAASEKAEG
jgi:hypothetical protein